jgi:hypothetical protein
MTTTEATSARLLTRSTAWASPANSTSATPKFGNDATKMPNPKVAATCRGGWSPWKAAVSRSATRAP